MTTMLKIVGTLFLGIALSSSQATIPAGRAVGFQDCKPRFNRAGRVLPVSNYCVEQMMQAMCGEPQNSTVNLQPSSLNNPLTARSASAAVAGGVTYLNGSAPRVRPRAKRWSDPATWGGQVPAPGAAVLIPVGQVVLLDQDARVAGLRIEGGLVFDRKNVHLQAESILVTGRLEIGTTAAPFLQRALITLIGPESDLNIGIMGTKFLSGMGKGTIEMVGESGRNSWTQLAETAPIGASDIVVLNASQWRVGDRIAIAPSDLEPREHEQRTIVAVNGQRISLDQPLAYRHWGEQENIAGRIIDQRAEVGLLSRNITITSDALQYPGFGGHIMMMEQSKLKLEGVEVSRMGQPGRLGRYSIHFHKQDAEGAGSFLRNSSLHSAHQRGLVVHQTESLQVSSNVFYDIRGHGVFLEDSVNEVRNRFEKNLVMGIRYVPRAYRLSTPDGDNRAERLSGFWITAAHNTFIDNRVAGVENGWGYIFADPDRPLPRELWYHPDSNHRLHMLAFENNTAHSIGFNGAPPDGGKGVFNLAYGPEEAGSCIRMDAVPYENGTSALNVNITGFTAYKCRNAAIWDTNGKAVRNSIVADSRVAFHSAQGSQRAYLVEDSLVVAGTRNNPAGRSLAEVLTYSSFLGPALKEELEAAPVQLNRVETVGALF